MYNYAFIIKSYGVYQEIQITYEDELKKRYKLERDEIIPHSTVMQILDDIFHLAIGKITPSEMGMTDYMADTYINRMINRLKEISINEHLDLTSNDLDWYYAERR